MGMLAPVKRLPWAWALWAIVTGFYLIAFRPLEYDISVAVVLFWAVLNHQMVAAFWLYHYPQLPAYRQIGYWGFFIASNVIALDFALHVLLTHSLLNGWSMVAIWLWSTPIGITVGCFASMVAKNHADNC